MHLRDPFVLVDGGRYYLYGSRCGENFANETNGLDVFIGSDLENWEGPHEVFTPPAGFWSDRDFWAPEVHRYAGAYYMFASFKSETRARGTQILKADTPEGPFRPISGGPVTPEGWECLDGTLYVDGTGTPYMVFCHEWVQIGDGTICAMPLSADLTRPAGEPRVLFSASQAPWIRPLPWRDGKDGWVTDGPFLYKTPDGDLLMLWSSMGAGGYTLATARSDNGDISGNWSQDPEPVFHADGGHGMVFEGLDGQRYLTLHTPNAGPKERPAFLPVDVSHHRLTIR